MHRSIAVAAAFPPKKEDRGQEAKCYFRKKEGVEISVLLCLRELDAEACQFQTTSWKSKDVVDKNKVNKGTDT